MKRIAAILLISCLQLKANIPSMQDLTNVVTALIQSGSIITATNYTYYAQTNYTQVTQTNSYNTTNTVTLTNTTSVYVTNQIYNITNTAVVTNVTYNFTNSVAFAVSNLPPTIQSMTTNMATASSVVIRWLQPFSTTNYSAGFTFQNSTNPTPLCRIDSRTTTNTSVSFWDDSGNARNFSGIVYGFGILNTP